MASACAHGEWRGRLIMDPSHAPELEAAAAVHELGEGLPRHEAEERAHEGYLRSHMTRAAAHHLAGIRAAHAVGNVQDGAEHGMFYRLLAHTMGFSPEGEPPAEVAALARDPERTPTYKHKPHAADAVVLEHLRRQRAAGQDVRKAEGDAPLAGVDTDHGVDMSHCLPKMRQDAGERLVVVEGPAGRTAHHLREEVGRHVPLATFQEQDGEAAALGGAPASDVLRAASLALRIRRAAEVASLLPALKRVAALATAARGTA